MQACGRGSDCNSCHGQRTGESGNRKILVLVQDIQTVVRQLKQWLHLTLSEITGNSQICKKAQIEVYSMYFAPESVG